MANRRHVINLHTSASTVAPGSDADLKLGEIAVQHTPDNPALWIKMGSGETSEIYEKFIGQTEILELINNSNILGSGYTYSGLPYVNSSTTIADAFSAITSEVIKDERVTAAAINDLNTGLNRVKHDLADDEYTIALALNDLNDRVTSASGACSERIDEDEEIVAGLINILSDRIGTVETRMTGDYIPITGYELASGTSEEELSLTEEDTVNEAFGKLQKQMLDNEEAIAAGLNDVNARIGELEEEISHNTGVTVLSGVVKTLSSTTASLSGAVEDSFNNLYENVLPNYTQTGDTQALSATVMSISAKTSGILTLNLNGVEQGVYSPSADTTINLEAIQEITGADVLLTGYELASGSTEEELVVLATDSVNRAFGKLQKQNYDNEAVVAGALNDLDERIAALEASGASAEDVEVLSGIAEDHEERLDVLEISAATNNDLLILSGVVIDDELVTAHALIELNKKFESAASVDDVLVLSGAVQAKDIVIAAALNDLNDKTTELSGKTNNLESSVTSLNTRVDTLETSATSVNTRLNTISGETVLLKSNKEDKSNKVSAVTSASTDVQYPTAKCLYDLFETLTRRTRLTSFSLDVLKQAVAEQNLEKYGLKVGDETTINGYTYVIAGLNPMAGTYMPYRVNVPHVGLIVIPHTTQAWNVAGNTYTGADGRGAGYKNCDLHYYLKNTTLPHVQNDLGSGNLIAHYKLLSNAVNTTGYNRYGTNTGCASSWDWETDCYISALSEIQVYGSIVWSSAGYDTGEACRQLDVFRVYNMNEIFKGEYPWLRDIASASFAARVSTYDHAINYPASYAYYVAALILFH